MGADWRHHGRTLPDRIGELRIKSLLKLGIRMVMMGNMVKEEDYSLAGNMTRFPKPSNPANGFGGTCDAWNRLVAVSDGATTVAT
jgi:hypothetical protein